MLSVQGGQLSATAIIRKRETGHSLSRNGSLEGRKCMWCIIIFLLAQKMLRKAFIVWEGVADEFLTEIMCIGVSASACCLNKYLEPQSRGRTESERSSSYLNRCVLFESVCFLFFFLFFATMWVMHYCILLCNKWLLVMLCLDESLPWCEVPRSIALPYAAPWPGHHCKWELVLNRPAIYDYLCCWLVYRLFLSTCQPCQHDIQRTLTLTIETITIPILNTAIQSLVLTLHVWP